VCVLQQQDRRFELPIQQEQFMPRFLRPAVLCVAAFTLGACESLTGPGTGVQPPLDRLPRALSVQEQQLIRASNSFAFDILRETIRDEPAENVFLSPLSASLALGMTLNGARGPTQDEMRAVLGYGNATMAEVNAAYRSLIDLLLRLDSRVDMRIANSVWANAGFPFHQSFYDTVKEYFDATATSLDFYQPGAPAVINGWVKEKTGGRIESIVPDPIPPLVVMYLINAIYFKADWTHQFDRSATRDHVFTRANGERRNVKMMNRTGRMLHYHDYSPQGVAVVELPYSRGAYAMTLVLPPAGADVDDFAAGLTQQQWNGWLDALEEGQLALGVPRFRLEYETTMNSALIELGMGRAFGTLPGTDFSGLSPRGRELYISRVMQKTFVDVNEEGTEAAAATAVEISRVSGPPSITFDRPFVVAIRERLTGTLLFLGKVGDPESK
jgi:serine protease inhibitor